MASRGTQPLPAGPTAPGLSTWRLLPDDRPATDLRVVRWAAMLFLVVDSTDSLIGIVAPSSVVTRQSGLDLAQTVLGLSACACLLWWRWRWAAVTTALVVAAVLVRHPVGIEVNLLIVGAATLAAVLRPRAVLVSLGGWVAFAAAIGLSRHLETGVGWLPLTLVGSLLAGLATLAGAVAGRLLRDREQSRAALRRVRAENVRIRADERRQLADELQRILTEDFITMRATVEQVDHTATTGDLRATVALVGDQSRSSLASVRVALRTLREELDPADEPAPHAPGWIDTLRTDGFRRLLLVVCVLVTCLALGEAVTSTGRVGDADDSPLGLLHLAVGVASPLTVAVALWRTRVGLVAAVVVLLVGLLTPVPSLWTSIPTALLCFTAARRGRWSWTAAAVAAQLAYMAGQLARHGSEAGTLVGVLEGVGITAILLGLTLCHFESVDSSTRAELEQLHTRQRRIASEERAEVARELHDVVGHQLSLVSLQALAAEGEHDAAVLHGLVRRISAALESGESEISGLVGALHSTTGDLGSTVPVLTPTVVASELSRQLQGHDYHARFAIDPRVDGLDPTTQSTVARILQESGTNVLRHAPTGADCTFTATIDDGTLTFLARSPLPRSTPDPYLARGYGLRGIRERVDLTGGTFFAGSRDGSWEVRVCISADPDDVA